MTLRTGDNGGGPLLVATSWPLIRQQQESTFLYPYTDLGRVTGLFFRTCCTGIQEAQQSTSDLSCRTACHPQ
ncbi:unnamed protein product [Urochloa humidicola]